MVNSNVCHPTDVVKEPTVYTCVNVAVEYAPLMFVAVVVPILIVKLPIAIDAVEDVFKANADIEPAKPPAAIISDAVYKYCVRSSM